MVVVGKRETLTFGREERRLLGQSSVLHTKEVYDVHGSNEKKTFSVMVEGILENMYKLGRWLPKCSVGNESSRWW